MTFTLRLHRRNEKLFNLYLMKALLKNKFHGLSVVVVPTESDSFHVKLAIRTGRERNFAKSAEVTTSCVSYWFSTAGSPCEIPSISSTKVVVCSVFVAGLDSPDTSSSSPCTLQRDAHEQRSHSTLSTTIGEAGWNTVVSQSGLGLTSFWFWFASCLWWARTNSDSRHSFAFVGHSEPSFLNRRTARGLWVYDRVARSYIHICKKI